MKQILQDIVPTKQECEEFTKVADAVIKKIKIKDADAILGGSGAKDTWLATSHDIDIFVQFARKYEDKSISDILEKVLKKAFTKIERLHGSRDYFQLFYKGYTIELVPIIKITKAENACNITDVSPLHATWVNKQSMKVKNEIRLAKQFCKANKLYGAESYIAGFSGYIIEILIVYYGSFEKLLRASLQWKPQLVVDVEKHYKNRKMALFHLNKSKTQSPLIIIDPVDKGRNAAAALGAVKLREFTKLAKKYLQTKDLSYFTEKKVTKEMIIQKKGKQHLTLMTITPQDGKRDVIGMKLRKTFEYIEKSLAPFALLKAGWEWNPGEDALLYYYTKKDMQSSSIVRKGPPLKMKVQVTNFKKKNKDTYIKNKTIFANITVKHPSLKAFIKSVLKEKYVTERTRKVIVELY
ncbi:TPA: CCA tRNA nucleotidyltransferase [Candidatus Woesearchaeota archaeon]|nr:CCA tRNA nucleotidyltransferase [Candidatus Woesearchaeota archaeon]